MNTRQWWGVTREHIRAQRSYSTAMAIMVAVAVTLIATAGLAGTEAQARDHLFMQASGPNLDHHAWVSYYTHGTPELEHFQENMLDPEQAAQLIDSIADQADRHALWGYVMAPHPDVSYHVGLVGAQGDTHWDLILLEGAAPRDGEVVLSARTARALDAQVGDTVTFAGDARIVDPSHPDGTEYIHRTASFTVSGISRIEPDDSHVHHAPDGFVSYQDLLLLQQTYGLFSGRNDAGQETFLIDLMVSWDGDVTVDPAFKQGGLVQPSRSAGQYLMDQGSAQAQIAGLLGAVLGLVVLIAALAMARNRAAQRTQWVATARALGARTSHLMTAALAEAVLLAAASMAVGVGGAYGLHALLVSQRRAAHPEVLDIAAPALTGWLVGLMGLVALVLSLAVAATPALWAVRTSPVAALKPAPPAVQEPLRPVAWRRGALLLVAGSLFTVLLEKGGGTWGVAKVALAVTVVAAVLGAVMVMLAVLQWALRRCASRLQRRRSPWAHTAADALRAKELQFMVIAGCFMVVGALITGGYHLFLLDSPAGLPSLATFWDTSLLDMGGYASTVVLALLATAIGAAVGLSTVSAARPDTATRSALGLTRGGIAWSRFTAHAVSTAVGLVVGVVSAVVALTALLAVNATVFDVYAHGVGWGAHAMGLTLVAGLWAGFVALLFGLLGASLVGFIAVERAPMEELTRSH